MISHGQSVEAWVIVLLAAIVSFVIIGFVMLFWRLASRLNAGQCNRQWLESFSLDSYAPLERLLDSRDQVFLASQTGYRPAIGKRLMKERREIFGGYLDLLVADFNQLIAIGKLMVVYSSQDQPEFASTLFRQQLKFYALVCLVRCQLALYPLPWTLVDARDLIRALESMRDRVQQLSSQPAAG